MQKNKEIWWEMRDGSPEHVLSQVYNLGYANILCDAPLASTMEVEKMPRGVGLCVNVTAPLEIEELKQDPALWERCRTVFVSDPAQVDEARDRSKRPVGFQITVDDRPALDLAVQMASRVDVVLVDLVDATNIPLELILATTQGTRTAVFKRVQSAEDGHVSSMTMEQGSDGIVIASDELEQVIALERAMVRSNVQKLSLCEGTVVRVEHAGMGNRVCVDTTSELTQDEGMLLGSTSAGGILTCSETHFLPYMNLRPFRVNAGSFHLYVWGPDHRALYLSELRAGDRVLTVNSKGDAREVTVGRVKIERRPVLLIECEVEGQRINTFVQDDWHVRLMGAGGKIRPSAEIRPGEKLLCHLDQPGRHVGIKVSETIVER